MKKYLKIFEKIRFEILEKKNENQKIPSENELCKLYSVSRTTIRKALKLLENQNLIYSVKGSGTFVSPKKIILNISSFYQLFFELEKIGLKLTSKIIEKNIIYPTQELISQFGILPTVKLFKITWVRYANNEAILYESLYFPYSLVPKIEKIDLKEIWLYKTLKNNYNLEVTHIDEEFYPKFLNEEEARFLKRDTNTIGIKIEKISYNENNIIEYTNSILLSERFKLRNTTKK